MSRIRNIAGKSRVYSLKTGAAIILVGGIPTTAMSQPPPIVGTSTDSQHNFLRFQNYPAVRETPFTAQAYMNAVDPGGKKVDVRDWLLNAGFINNRDDWRTSGQQTFTQQHSTPLSGDYGPGKINAFSHIIMVNAGDLGFIRNQYIRCKPDCKTKGAKIYTYLENYAVPANAAGNINLTQQAVSKALEQRVGRIADVAFEWAPPSNNPTSTDRFGQIYAFVVKPDFVINTFGCPSPNNPTGTIGTNADGTQTLDELYNWPNDQAFWDCKFNSRSATTVGPEFLDPRPDFTVFSGDVFAAELDRLGTKQSPGVCYICHGGNVPSTVQNTLVWPNAGKDKEFKFLPADVDNAVFGVDDRAAPLVAGATGSNLTRAGQETEFKKYNQAVAITQGATQPTNAVFAADGTITGGNWKVPKSTDDQGTLRPSHALEIIFGWYAGFPGDLSMSGNFQDGTFTPSGWLPAKDLYHKVVKPSCRSCHMNREQSLDFGTLAQFDSNKGNVQDLVFQPECDSNAHRVKPGAFVMPLAKLTWDRFWKGFDPVTKLTNADNTLSATDPNSQPVLLKAHFGYTATSYCGSQH